MSKKTYIIVLICLIIISSVLLIVSAYTPKGVPLQEPPIPPHANTSGLFPTLTPRHLGNDFTFNQEEAEKQFMVGYARLEDPSFFVFQDEINGQPGTILGVSPLVPDGESRQIVIPLQRLPQKGASYFITVHIDNDDGVFGPEDEPALDDEGEPVQKEFIPEEEH